MTFSVFGNFFKEFSVHGPDMFQIVSENRPHISYMGGARLIIGGTCARPLP